MSVSCILSLFLLTCFLHFFLEFVFFSKLVCVYSCPFSSVYFLEHKHSIKMGLVFSSKGIVNNSVQSYLFENCVSHVNFEQIKFAKLMYLIFCCRIVSVCVLLGSFKCFDKHVANDLVFF